MNRFRLRRVWVTRVTWQLMVTLALTLVLGSLPVNAQEGKAAAPEIEEKAITLVKRMATVLSQAKQLSFTADVGFDVVQDSGQKIEFGETRKIVVRRPDHIRIDATKRDGSVSGFVFDGKQIAVFNVQDKVYATVAKPGTVDEAIDYFTQNLDMRMPLGELLASDLPQLLQERLREADYVEQATIAGVLCDHVALRAERADVQLWIAGGDQPLPRRLVITYTRAEGQPQFWAQFSDWNLSPEVSDSLFAFTPPTGAVKIAFAPRRPDGSETSGQRGEVQ
jgi:hypothetical protein